MVRQVSETAEGGIHPLKTLDVPLKRPHSILDHTELEIPSVPIRFGSSG